MSQALVLLLASMAVAVGVPAASGPGWVSYGSEAAAPHVVLLGGDEEYRSEEALPMLARILAARHGLRATVLLSHDPDGTVNPKRGDSLARPEVLDTADALVISLRFRRWNADALARFDAALRRGVPVVALRTSTHAFAGIPADSPQAWYNWDREGGFGRKVLGETWLTHWGHHGVEGTLARAEPANAGHPVLRGVGEIFGDSDVYEAYPPEDATVLLRGLVLKGMDPAGPLSEAVKRRARGDKGSQPVNAPPMPVAWVREVPNAGGTSNRVLCSTLGAATDLADPDLRRLVVNGVLWGLRREVPPSANVDVVVPFAPSRFAFEGFRKGWTAAQLGEGKR